MGRSLQNQHSKSLWRTHRSIAMQSIAALSRVSQTTPVCAAMIHTATNYSDALEQLEKLTLHSKDISATIFNRKFDMLSDLGCTQLFRFSVLQYVYRDERELCGVSATKIEGLISTFPRIGV